MVEDGYVRTFVPELTLRATIGTRRIDPEPGCVLRLYHLRAVVCPALGMTSNHRDIVVIGASAGGVQALQRLVAALPGDFPASIFVVLHIWPGSHSYLPAILGRAGP